MLQKEGMGIDRSKKKRERGREKEMEMVQQQQHILVRLLFSCQSQKMGRHRYRDVISSQKAGNECTEE